MSKSVPVFLVQQIYACIGLSLAIGIFSGWYIAVAILAQVHVSTEERFVKQSYGFKLLIQKTKSFQSFRSEREGG